MPPTQEHPIAVACQHRCLVSSGHRAKATTPGLENSTRQTIASGRTEVRRAGEEQLLVSSAEGKADEVNSVVRSTKPLALLVLLQGPACNALPNPRRGTAGRCHSFQERWLESTLIMNCKVVALTVLDEIKKATADLAHWHLKCRQLRLWAVRWCLGDTELTLVVPYSWGLPTNGTFRGLRPQSEGDVVAAAYWGGWQFADCVALPTERSPAPSRCRMSCWPGVQVRWCEVEGQCCLPGRALK